MIIAFAGNKRSGKDTAANILVNSFNFKKIAFADGVRDLCANVFDIPKHVFTNDETKEVPFTNPIIIQPEHIADIEVFASINGFEITEESHIKLSNFIGTQLNSPRHVLQIIGTDVVRGSIDDLFWVKETEGRIKKLDDNVVISDMRFESERSWAKNTGALQVLINRPTIVSNDTHTSENQLGSKSEYDIFITNDYCSASAFEHDIHAFFSEKLKQFGIIR